MDIFFRMLDSYLGVPYRWGGQNRWEGFDCSGFVIEVMSRVGEGPPMDLTAQGLYDYYQRGKAEWNSWKPGALVFFGNSATDIRHVGILVDQYRMYESAGGDHTTIDMAEAIRRNAQVRISLVSERKDSFRAVLRPYYRKIGQI